MKIAQDGLPSHLFEYVSSITPIINVDLLVHNPCKGIILSWRSDKFYGPGWHIPGGIIRFKENFLDRLKYVARNEINLNEDMEFNLISINQIMNPERDIRGHFISLLFSAEIHQNKIINNGVKEGENGFLKWYKYSPENLIKQHKRYETHIEQLIKNTRNKKIDIGNIMDSYSPNHEK